MQMSVYKQSAVTGAFVTSTLAITIRSIWHRLNGAKEEANLATAPSLETDINDMRNEIDGSYGGIYGFSALIAIAWIACFSVTLRDNRTGIWLKYSLFLAALFFTSASGLLAIIACSTYSSEFDRFCPPKNVAVSGMQAIYINCVAQDNLIDDMQIMCPALHFYSLSGIFMWFVCIYYYYYRNEEFGAPTGISGVPGFQYNPVELSRVYLKKLIF